MSNLFNQVIKLPDLSLYKNKYGNKQNMITQSATKFEPLQKDYGLKRQQSVSKIEKQLSGSKMLKFADVIDQVVEDE